MPKIFPFTAAKVVTQTYTTSQNILIPVGVNSLKSVIGKGADGSPATTGHYGPNKNNSIYVVSVTGSNTSGGSIAGNLNWQDLQFYMNQAISNLNFNANGSFTVDDYTQYISKYTSISHSTSYIGAISGTAYSYTSSGWKTQGPITPSDFAFAYVAWQSIGDWISGTPVTTGASTTGFGLTYAGGVGGPASPRTDYNVAVVPQQSYSLVIPSGGYITIQYTVS